MADDLLVIGFYTEDADYHARAKAMSKSVAKHGLECIIEPQRSKALEHRRAGLSRRAKWTLNCSIKPEFCLHMRELYPNRPLLYLDADATMKQPPRMMMNGGVCRRQDFAAVYWIPTRFNGSGRAALCSGTLYFGPTERATALLRVWKTRQEAACNAMLRNPRSSVDHVEAWDQTVLQECVDRRIPLGLRVKRLPLSYCKITPATTGRVHMAEVKDEDVVILQDLASRHNCDRVR